MENTKNTKSFYSTSANKSRARAKSSTPLKQTVLEQFGIRSPKRSLFTESNNILFSKKSLPTNGLSEAQTEEPKEAIKEPKESSSPPSKNKVSSQTGGIRLPLISLQRLSEAYLASKLKVDKLAHKDDDNQQCLEEKDDSVSSLTENLKSSCNMSEQTSVSLSFSSNDGEDDEDELLEVGFLNNLKSNNRVPSSVKNKKEKQYTHLVSSCSSFNRKPFVQPQYKYGLNSILSEREKKAETDNKLLEMEMELKLDPVYDFDAMNILNENQLDLKKFTFETQSINFIHPGLNVFELSNCFRLYQTPLFPSSLQKNFKSEPFDELLQKVQPHDFSELLKLGALDHQVVNLTERPWMLNYIFHLLASHRNPQVVHACYKTLKNVHNYFVNNRGNTKIWFPSLQDVAAVLLNFGASLNMLHPEPKLLPFTEQEICDKYTLDSQQKKNVAKSFPANNLCQVIEIVANFVDCADAYTQEELVVLIVFCYAIALDETMKKVLIEHELLVCIRNALEKISYDFWDSKLVELVQQLLKLTDHHHNMVVIGQLMPYSERGLQLQGVLAYNALHDLMQVKLEKQILHIKPQHVLKFFKTYLQNKLHDYYLLSSIFTLIDLCIGKEPDVSSRKTLLEFTTLMKDSAGKIRDRIQCADATEVKNYMINIASKWMFIAQNMPSAQKTLFDYVSTHYKIEQVKDGSNLDDGETTKSASVDVPMIEENTENMH